MATHFSKLISSALVIPDADDDIVNAQPIALGPGTVVARWEHDTDRTPPISPREHYVGYHDCIGRTRTGWLAERTPFASTPAKVMQYSPYDPASPITAWDSLRERFAKRVTPAWSFQQWGASLKGPENLALVRLALRELGATCDPQAAASTLVMTLMRVTFTPQEVRSMSDAAEAVAAPASAKKTPVKKPAAKKVVAPARSMSRTVGQALKDAGFTSPLIAKLLKDEKVTKTQLTELRDAINTKASAMRDADKAGPASKLSAANKLVRRLARSK